jgi:UDP-GlcNAc:undecaprenyl-phosphate GlcNAc-1-phosphate transferase
VAEQPWQRSSRCDREEVEMGLFTGSPFAIVAPFALSAAVTGLSIPVARALGILDRPGATNIHLQMTPRFGGVGIVAGVLVPTILLRTMPPLALLGLVAVAATGALDDKFLLRPIQKLCGEAVAGICLGMPFIHGPMGLASVPVAVALAVGLTNAVNFIDGMDGLAAGYTVISALGLAAVLSALGLSSAFAVSLALAALGFLLWNFPRARTFMGDVGSLAIGYCLAFLLMSIGSTSWRGALSALPMIAVPVYDMSLAVMRRRMRRRPILEGDRDHFYDVLCGRLGSKRLTVCIVYAVSLTLASLGILATRLALVPTICLYGVVLLVMAAAAPGLGFLPKHGSTPVAGALGPASGASPPDRRPWR